MKRIFAAIQVVIVLLIVGYGTVHLFKGNFEVMMVTVPLLVGYYLCLLAIDKRSKAGSGKD